MGVIVGKPMQSPDVIYDMKERVHRTPHVGPNSALPSPVRFSSGQEQDLMMLITGDVIKLQVRTTGVYLVSTERGCQF